MCSTETLQQNQREEEKEKKIEKSKREHDIKKITMQIIGVSFFA